MADAQLVNVEDSGEELLQVLACRALLELLVLDDEVEQLASTCELHDQVQVLLCLDNFINLNHVRVMELLENLDLSANPFNVLLVLDL